MREKLAKRIQREEFFKLTEVNTRTGHFLPVINIVFPGFHEIENEELEEF